MNGVVFARGVGKGYKDFVYTEASSGKYNGRPEEIISLKRNSVGHRNMKMILWLQLSYYFEF